MPPRKKNKERSNKNDEGRRRRQDLAETFRGRKVNFEAQWTKAYCDELGEICSKLDWAKVSDPITQSEVKKLFPPYYSHVGIKFLRNKIKAWQTQNWSEERILSLKESLEDSINELSDHRLKPSSRDNVPSVAAPAKSKHTAQEHHSMSYKENRHGEHASSRKRPKSDIRYDFQEDDDFEQTSSTASYRSVAPQRNQLDGQSFRLPSPTLTNHLATETVFHDAAPRRPLSGRHTYPSDFNASAVGPSGCPSDRPLPTHFRSELQEVHSSPTGVIPPHHVYHVIDGEKDCIIVLVYPISAHTMDFRVEADRCSLKLTFCRVPLNGGSEWFLPAHPYWNDSLAKGLKDYVKDSFAVRVPLPGKVEDGIEVLPAKFGKFLVLLRRFD
ncbi:hypothetical protein DFJ73DRAFT_962711 [Zopfochytrium polystomum]|nr:hypothetical protein DFJ73DRAFT_962711 [Zopfochytrium polystomum]